MTQVLTQPEMAAWDAATLEVILQQARANGVLSSLYEQAHRLAGDKKHNYSRWGYTHQEALSALAVQGGDRAHLLLLQVEEAQAAIAAFGRVIEEREEFWDANGRWTRYFPCLNRDGHIHSSMYGCKTVTYETHMGWATEMSGLTVDQAIHEGIPGQFPALGETLCTVCFPDAPAEWCRTRSEVTRAERAAAKAEKDAARDAARAMKELSREEAAFLSHAAGERVTTVAAAKALIRSFGETEVELEANRRPQASARWNTREGYQNYIAYVTAKLATEKVAAEQAAKILADREAALPGSGWTRGESYKALEGARKRTRKAYGL